MLTLNIYYNLNKMFAKILISKKFIESKVNIFNICNDFIESESRIHLIYISLISIKVFLIFNKL